MSFPPDAIVGLNIDINHSLLSKEARSGKFENFTNKKYNVHFKHWWIKSVISGTYSDALSTKLARLINTKNYKTRIFRLEKGHNISMHKDDGTLCAINIVLSDTSEPVTFEKYGKVRYKVALLNTQEPHGVFNISQDRVLFKISIFDLSYKTCRRRLKKMGLISY